MIVAGFGFTGRATTDSLLSALAATDHAGAPDRIATASDKAAASAFVDLAARLGTPIIAVAPTDIEAAPTQTRSRRSQAARDTGSLAEAAALAAAGPGATLIVTRHISTDRMATCAIAKGADT